MDHYGEVVLFQGKNVLPLYMLVHWKESLMQRCPLFRVSFIRSSTVSTYVYACTFVEGEDGSVSRGEVGVVSSGQIESESSGRALLWVNV